MGFLKKIIKKAVSDDIIKHNLVFFMGFMSFNVMNYFFHFSMGRMLGPVDYGILGVLMSIAYIVTAPITTIQTVITKFTAKFKAKKSFEKIKCLFVQSSKKMLIFSALLTSVFIISSSRIASFLNIDDKNIIIFFSLIFLIIFVLAICRGFLQGLEKFRALSLSYVLEGITKLSLAIFLVYLNFKIFGAIAGLLLGALISLIFILLFFKKPKKFERVDSKEIYKYALPVLVSITLVFLIQNIDVIFVKHYLTEIQAGLYVAVSTLAKIIFFAGMSISFVMFPKVAEKFSSGKEYFSVFKKSFLLVLALSLGASVFYLAVPKLVVLLLYGEQYIAGSGLLRLFGLSFIFLSFSYLIINYLLSINKFRFIYFLGFSFILETVLIILFHNTLQQIIYILFAVNAILLLYLSVDLIKNEIIPNNSSI